MALFIFTKSILEGKPIFINNNGNMERDFTYIDDIVESVTRIIDKPAEAHPDWNGDKPDPSTSPSPYRIFNIGNNSPVKLMDFIKAIEKELGMEAIKEYRPMQAGDVPSTWAEVDKLNKLTGFKPSTPIGKGIREFISWYRTYYSV
jgi:UDP-glucuronate 4-epimerase